MLAVVVYNGRVHWRAATTLADLVGKGTRPQAGAKPSAPAFAGERYELIDLGSYELDKLPEGNIVSLVVAAERMSRREEVASVLEDALRLLSSAEREKLRDTFLSWFRLLVARTGVDLDFLEDRVMVEQIEQSGALRTTLEERFQALRDADVAKGVARERERWLARERERGLARERELLVHLAGRKFGPEVAETAAGLLVGILDWDRLQEVGEWIIDYGTGSELLARLQEIS